jgi:hypothetical protein
MIDGTVEDKLKELEERLKSIEDWLDGFEAHNDRIRNLVEQKEAELKAKGHNL